MKFIPESTIYETSSFGQVMNRRHTCIIWLSSNPVHGRIYTSMCQGIVQYSPAHKRQIKEVDLKQLN